MYDFPLSINLDSDFAIVIVKSCVVLHNFVLQRDGYNTKDTLSITGLQSITRRNECVRGRFSTNNVRKIMMEYFLTSTGSKNVNFLRFNEE